MRTLAAALALVFLLTGTAFADQKDPRLDNLFKALKEAAGPGEALPVEDAIWTIWLESGDRQTDQDMERGMTAMARGDYGDAVSAFDDVVQEKPDFAEGWNKRATVYYLLGEFDASVADIQKTLALEPRHFGALSGLGLIYLEIDEDEGALKAYSKALEIHPFLSGAKAQVQDIHRRLGGKEI
jgi:tetratricopeptide (TPR) repeat protein